MADLRRAENAIIGWQPIETAPKDGTVVDLWCYWPEQGKSKRTPDCKYDAKYGWAFGRFYDTQYVDPPQITHWMKIPDGPTT